MVIKENKAYAYWDFLGRLKKYKLLHEKKLIFDDEYERRVEFSRRNLHLDETSKLLSSETYQKSIEEAYGIDEQSCPIPAIQARYRTRQNAGIDKEYSFFTAIVNKRTTNITPSYAMQCWLREKNTLEFLILWEQEHNAAFDSKQARMLVSELSRTSTSMTIRKWISRTAAKGIVSLPGRYGGTYADPMIALTFEFWLSPQEYYSKLKGYNALMYSSEKKSL